MIVDCDHNQSEQKHKSLKRTTIKENSVVNDNNISLQLKISLSYLHKACDTILLTLADKHFIPASEDKELLYEALYTCELLNTLFYEAHRNIEDK